MPSVIYNSLIQQTVKGEVDFGTDAFRVMLLSDDYRPDRKRHSTTTDVAGAEVDGIGYTPGGNSVAVTVDSDSNNNHVDIALGGSAWEQSSIRARGAAYYKVGNSELVAYIDFGGEVTSSNGTFELTASTLRIQN